MDLWYFYIYLKKSLSLFCISQGANRLSQNIFLLTGEKTNKIFIFCWKYFAPLFILAIWGLNWYSYESVRYGSYVYPTSVQIFGWCIALISIIAIPIGAIHTFLNADGTSFKHVNKFV